MRKRLKNKRHSCAMCKPHKMGHANRWKIKDFAKLARFERHIQRGWHDDV